MDIMELLGRQQISLMSAARASCERSRDAHARLADLYAARIGAMWGVTGGVTSLARPAR